MEAAELRERGRSEQDPGAADVTRAVSSGPFLSGTSYWLDVWLFILFDLVLFLFVYLLP